MNGGWVEYTFHFEDEVRTEVIYFDFGCEFIAVVVSAVDEFE